MIGRVIKILSEFSYVKAKNEIVYPCKAKGIFRHEKMKVITGDIVKFDPPTGQELHGLILEIEPRKNDLYRPQIANIDQVVVISSVKDPNFDSYILNKYLTFLSWCDLKSIIAFTKVDLIASDNVVFSYINDYAAIDWEVYRINNIQPSSEEWIPFTKTLQNKVSIFTGQTGAGKSTTLNNLLPNVFQKTQEISRALGRGKHTTTSNEMFAYDGGYIADTPGFSSFDLKKMTATDVAKNFLNFNLYHCKFNDCLHNTQNKEICGVFAAYQEQKIPQFMYDDYQKLLLEFSEGRGRK